MDSDGPHITRWERFANWVVGFRRIWRWCAHYEDGTYWADSATHPTFTAAAPTLDGLLQLLKEAGTIERWGRGLGLIDAEAFRADVNRRMLDTPGTRVTVKARPEWDASVYIGKTGTVVHASDGFANLTWVNLDHPIPGQRNPLAFQTAALERIITRDDTP